MSEDAEQRLSLRQANQARADFAATHDDLEFIKVQLARVPTRQHMARPALPSLSTGTALAIIGIDLLDWGF